GVFARRTCPDADGDAICDVDDILITSPGALDEFDCAPGVAPPSFTWSPGSYDRFQVVMASSPAFAAGTRVTSGSKLLTSTAYTPPAKKWASACAKALQANPLNPVMFLEVKGVDVEASKKNPNRKTSSQVLQVDVVH